MLFEQLCGRKIAQGEIACTLSHILCWQKIAQNDMLADKDFAIIAEDDIVLSADFEEITRAILQNPILKEDYKLIILHKLSMQFFIGSEPMNKDEYRLIKLSHISQAREDGAALYLLRKDRAKELIHYLAGNKPYWLADQFNLVCPIKNTLILYPYLGHIDENLGSDLQEEREIVEADLIKYNQAFLDKIKQSS